MTENMNYGPNMFYSEPGLDKMPFSITGRFPCFKHIESSLGRNHRNTKCCTCLIAFVAACDHHRTNLKKSGDVLILLL